MNTSIFPDVTIVIEWENAMDVEDAWTRRSMAALSHELRSTESRFRNKPTVLYIYDRNGVDVSAIRRTLDQAAPGFADHANVQLVPTDGLSYYKLKNFGASRATTELTIVLDSDAGPQPGWLAAMLTPFSDPDLQVVVGFTSLGYDGLWSKTMALSWILKLPSERLAPVERRKMYANNFAIRTRFFKDNPFPELDGSFKKACGLWQDAMLKRKVKFAYAPDGMTLHAPHPGGRFILWRGWTTGIDRDFKNCQLITRSRLARIGLAFSWWAYKVGRSWWRILTKGTEVDLPLWQRPAAMACALAFFSAMLAGQLCAALTASPKPMGHIGHAA